jgi:5-formyltetrahydrofolate cyclo-ligase
MFPPIAPLFSGKQILRERMKAERAKASAARPDAARHAAAKFLSAIPLDSAAVVALYAPLKDELDTGPLAEALAERGLALALPSMVGKRAPLAFRRAPLEATLVRGAFGVMEPGPDAAETRPDIVVCPLLAFSRDGARLGYGAGYYDRTLSALRASGGVLAVGYGFGAQEIERVPVGKTDEPLDWIVTEREAIRVR